MANNGFPHLDKEELRRMTAEASSRSVVAAFKETRRELRRRGERANWTDVARELSMSTSTYQISKLYLIAIDTYGISKRLPKAEAIKRMQKLDPSLKALTEDLDEVDD